MVIAARSHIGEIGDVHDISDYSDACHDVIMALLFEVVNSGLLDVESIEEPASMLVDGNLPQPPPRTCGQSQSPAQFQGSEKAASTTATTTTTQQRTCVRTYVRTYVK